MNQNGHSVSGPDRLVAAWIGWVIGRPRAILAALALLVLAAGLAATQLRVDADSSRMLSPDLPAQRQALAVNAEFPTLKQTIAILVTANAPDAADLAVLALTEALAQQADIDSVFAVTADPFLAAHGFMFRDLEGVASVFTRISKSSNLIAELRVNQTPDGFGNALLGATQLADRAELSIEALNTLYSEAADVLRAVMDNQPKVFGWSSVLDDEAPTGRVTRIISVLPKLDLTRLSPAKPALQSIHSAVASLPAPLLQGLDIRITGEPALRAEEMQSVLSTIGMSMALSLVLVALILRVGLGSTARAGLALLSLVVSLVVTTGFAGLFVGQLNLVSVAFIVLMVGLGIDFAIHLLAHATETHRTGAGTSDALILTGQRNGLALALSAVTTSLAFLAFAMTEFRGMAQLGVIGGIGVLISFAISVTLIPAIAALAPRSILISKPNRGRTAAPRRASPALSLGIVAIGVLALIPATQARFDADPIGLRDPDGEAVRAFQSLASDPETTPYRVSILAEDAAEAAAIEAAFENIPGIGTVVSAADLVPDEQDEKLTLLDIAAAPIEYAISGVPTDLVAHDANAADGLRGLADALYDREGMPERLYDMLEIYLHARTPERDAVLQDRLFRSFPLMLTRLEALLKADYVDIDSIPKVLRERFVSPDGIHRVEIIPETAVKTTEALAAFAAQVLAIDDRAAGGPIQLTAAGQTVGRAMLLATALAAIATTLLALSATGRVVDTLAILVPLAIAGIVTAAASVVLDQPFNYANVIVLPLLIGIGVDSGIHVALRERRAPGAIFATSTPRAVICSALTTMAAFGTLALSDHRGTASMGILLLVSMIATVTAVLTLTPAILRSATVRHPPHP